MRLGSVFSIVVLALLHPTLAHGQEHRTRSKSDLLTPQQIYRKSIKSVVRIEVTDSKGHEAVGSGFFVEDDTHVLTSFRLLNNAVSIRVVASPAESWIVDRISFGSIQDLAILKLRAPSGHKPLPCADLTGVRTGDPISIISVPVEQKETRLTVGFVNAIRRERGQDLLQFTSSIRVSASGTPIFDAKGRAIAMISGSNPNFGSAVSGWQRLQNSLSWSEFAVRAKSLVPDLLPLTSASLAEAQRRLVLDFGSWQNRRSVAYLRWRVELGRQFTTGSVCEPDRLAALYATYRSTVTEGMEQVRDDAAKVPDLDIADLDERVRNLASISKTLYDDEVVADRAFHSHGSEIATKRMNQTASLLAEAEARLLGWLSRKPWYSQDLFESRLEPLASLWLRGTSWCDAFPDPNVFEVARVTLPMDGSYFREGDEIDGIGTDLTGDISPIKTWGDVEQFLRRYPNLTRFYLRVRRNGQLVYFFSRPESVTKRT